MARHSVGVDQPDNIRRQASDERLDMLTDQTSSPFAEHTENGGEHSPGVQQARTGAMRSTFWKDRRRVSKARMEGLLYPLLPPSVVLRNNIMVHESLGNRHGLRVLGGEMNDVPCPGPTVMPQVEGFNYMN